MSIPNSTHYWQDTTRVFIDLPDTNSFFYESNRRMSFYLRLYYEYEYTRSVGGQTFYVTFTYNNKSIPLLFGKPVFNYEHIRLITNGVLSKTLLRKYGSRLKYLCACESGDGKGIRGKGNNPHYHFIFFVQPFSGSDYVPIPPSEFLALCQELWQGKRGYFPWKYARFGSVKEGKFGVSVTSTNALKYVSKYCLKDSVEKQSELYISEQYFNQALDTEYSFKNLYRYYKQLQCTVPNFSHDYFLRSFDASRFFELRRLNPNFSIKNYFTQSHLYYQSHSGKASLYDVGRFIERYHHWFLSVVVPEYVEDRMRIYKSMYSGKMRCSKSLGIYGMQFILDQDNNPHFKISEEKGPRIYKLPLYYVRHLYYNVVICPVSGNPLYVLNEKGCQLKLKTLSASIAKIYNNTLKNMNTLINNKLEYFYKSQTCVPFVQATSLRNSCDYLRTVFIYSLYSVVYKNRSYCSSTPLRLDSRFDTACYHEDYEMFLQNDRYKIDYENVSILSVFSRTGGTLFAFHPLFKPYYQIFEFLDSVNEHVMSHISDIRRNKFNDNSEHQKRIHAYENA